MSTKTTKLQLIKPDDTDYLNISDINANMDIIEGLVHIKESSSKTAKLSTVNTTDANGGNITWYYQKTNDGLVRGWACHTTSRLKCNSATGSQYYSGSIRFRYPDIGLTEIIYRNAYAGCATSPKHQFVGNNGYLRSTDLFQDIRLYANSKETSSHTKYIYLEFVGKWK